MSKLSTQIVAEVIEACKAGAEAAAAALGRAFEVEVKLSVGEPGTPDAEALAEDLAGAGLAIVLRVEEAGALLLLPESSGLLPAWYTDSDPTTRSKLATLAQELGMRLLPEEHTPEDFAAGGVGNLSEAIARGQLCESAAMVPLELTPAEGDPARLTLIWPIEKPGDVIEAAEPQGEPSPPAAAETAADTETSRTGRCPSVDDLPPYSRSLLRIKVPVVVTLAQKRQPLERILQLGPGAIIQFDKSCDEMLELSVGGRPIATGEAVKVDEKFGLRIKSMILPEERFRTVARWPVSSGPVASDAGSR